MIPEGHNHIYGLREIFKICHKTILKLKQHPEFPEPSGYFKNGNNKKTAYYNIEEFGSFIEKAKRERYAQQIEKPPAGYSGKTDLRKHLKCSYERIAYLLNFAKPCGYYSVIGRKNPYYDIAEIMALHEKMPFVSEAKAKKIVYEESDKWDIPQHTKQESKQCKLFNLINKQIAQALK